MAPRVMIVEDKMIVAQDVQRIIKTMGYEVVCIASSGNDAIKKFTRYTPDIILMDIRLKGNLNGIETSKKIQELGKPSIIYLTAQSNPEILKSAFETEPVNYLVKPFSEKDLQIALGLAANQLEKQKPGQDHIIVRHHGMIEKTPLDHILFAKANGSYTIIYTKEKSFTASFNLNQFEEKVNHLFVRTHRSYVVCLDKVERVIDNTIFIGKHEVPVSRSFKHDFLLRFKSL